MNKKNDTFYQPPDPDLWTGRTDSLPKERFYQRVICVDLIEQTMARLSLPGFAVVGFACDEGIRRNAGRVGAKEGPRAIRAALAKLACHMDSPIFYDVGDVICPDTQLEVAQACLGEMIAELLKRGIKPIVLGGGHELAFGHFQGIEKAFPRKKIGIINFDAHLDMRLSPSEHPSTSGTSFLQIAHSRAEKGLPFRYCCVGVQPTANTHSLFETAKKQRVTICSAQMCHQKTAQVTKVIRHFIRQQEKIYVSVCMDVFSQAHAPGVSAPQSFGLTPAQIFSWLELLTKSKKIVSIDIAEASPPLDENRKTVQLAAMLAASYMTLNDTSPKKRKTQ